jgi:hypothetical protein
MVLIVLALTSIITITQSPIAVESGTATAQAVEDEAKEEPTEAEGVSTFPLTETKEERDYDLYLDAAEVERLAAEEQSGSRATTTLSGVPLSFKHVALPLASGLDHAVAGVSTRNSGNGVIRLRGVPPGSQLVLALLVWGEITNAPGGYPIGFGPVCNGGTVFPGFLYGTTQQPCWNPGGVYAGNFANVTAAFPVGGPINGDYQVKGLKSAITDGRCPWRDAACAGSNALPLSEGASLIVFYINPCIPPGAQIYLSFGPRMFFGAHTVTHFVGPILPGMQVKHSRIGADGQVSRGAGAVFPLFDPSCGLRSFPPVSDEQTWIGGFAGLVQIKGNGAGLSQDSDWNGYDGEPLNKLWDSHSDMFSNSNIFAGGPSYTVTYQAHGDCIVWAAHILGIR